MKVWFLGALVGAFWLWVSCQASPPQQSVAASESDTLSPLPTSEAVSCETIQKMFRELSLPYTVLPPVKEETTREPFPPDLQSWFLEKLALNEAKPIFSPIGQIQYSDYTLWLVEATSANGTTIYALLVDSDCQIHDKLPVSAFKGSLNQVTIQSADFNRDGMITIHHEDHWINTSVEPPREWRDIYDKKHRVDSERLRFVAL